MLENIHPEAQRMLTGAGWEVEVHPGALTGAGLVEALAGVDYLGIRSRSLVTADVIAQAPNLRGIGAFCIGTNQIDLTACSDAGMAVFNAPYSNTRSVVELAIAEIITMARRLSDRNRDMHAGIWDKTATGSHEVRGRSLGIVGYGNIGSQLSVIAEAMGMRVYYYDLVEKLALGNAQRCDSLEELLGVAEVVSLHVDGRPENDGLFGEAEFAKMRPRSLFINLCRGSVADLDALHEALLSGHIAGAALDVFPTEPTAKGESFECKLRGVPNVILTPHIGGSTQEAQHDIGRFVAGKLIDYERVGITSMSVNLPQVAAQPAVGNRITHLHYNVPGVLARLNSALAHHNFNIRSQQLATRDSLGYVVTDVVGGHADGLIAELSALAETVRVRAL